MRPSPDNRDVPQAERPPRPEAAKGTDRIITRGDFTELPIGTIAPLTDYIPFVDAADGELKRGLPPTAGGATDHGTLSGLADDDHAHYALADGSRGAFVPSTHLSDADPHPQYPLLDGSSQVPIANLPTGSTAATVCIGDDARLSDARPPTAHAHAASDITSGTIATARLGSGTADATTFLRGDQTYAVPAGGSWTEVRKASDQIKASDTTFADDSELFVALSANTKYHIRGKAFFTTAGTPDIKFTFAGPASPTRLKASRRGIGGGAASITGILIDTAYGVTCSLVGTGVNGLFEFDVLLENGANTGNFAIQWAQNFSFSADTTVLRGSWLEWRTWT